MWLADNKLSNNKLSNNKLSGNNLASELLEKKDIFKPITTSEEIVIFMINNVISVTVYDRLVWCNKSPITVNFGFPWFNLSIGFIDFQGGINYLNVSASESVFFSFVFHHLVKTFAGRIPLGAILKLSKAGRAGAHLSYRPRHPSVRIFCLSSVGSPILKNVLGRPLVDLY